VDFAANMFISFKENNLNLETFKTSKTWNYLISHTKSHILDQYHIPRTTIMVYSWDIANMYDQ